MSGKRSSFDQFLDYSSNVMDNIFKVYIYDPYQSKYQFSYQQKIAILNYLFTKNSVDL
jgi:hypothetical protein